MRIFIALFFAAVIPVAAQTTEVPHKMDFAGITLTIRDDARKEIQKDVDALTASPKHYKIKAERAKTYFPIIEKVFREEDLPDDFKYLVLQESALIPDAVSTSNAVGFWQFKDFTAIEMGLRVDKEIDERLNIASSSRAAARYLIKNNQFFDNWLYALQSYQMGAGGVMRSGENTQAKATRMEITSKTYWYVKKFLAHKIAFEGGIGGLPETRVVVVENRQRTTLDELAKGVLAQEGAIKNLNKWAKSGIIPNDRTYVVLLPAENQISATASANEGRVTRRASPVTPTVATNAAVKSLRSKINGVNTIQAIDGDNALKLAKRAQVDLAAFLKWNDMTLQDPIASGQFYFLGRKRLKGSEDFHKVSEGESLWAISQRYGIQVQRLKRYNRMDEEINPAPGTMLFLASKRPKTDMVISGVKNPLEVSGQETFDWSVKTESPQKVVLTTDSFVVHSDAENVAQEAPSKAVDSVKILQTDKTEATFEDTETVIHVAVPEYNLATPENAMDLAESRDHTVKAGETLYAIANLYHMSVMDIVNLNDLNLQQGIHPGQVLKLAEAQNPKSVQPEDKTQNPMMNAGVFHEVKTSDTLYSIARQYSVTIKQIMEWNGKKDFSLSVGEKLKIMRGQ